MTAPAEDPRGGEGDCFETCQGHPSGGEAGRSVADSQIECDIAEVLHMHPAVTWADALDLSAQLLALPAVAALLDAQAKVERVEALCEDGGHEGWVSTRAVRRALDGA